MLVVVTGVPGVGKSTVMESVARSRDFRVVNFGTEMFKVAKARGLVEDRDRMRGLPAHVQREIQVQAAKVIAAMGDVFVDTHATVKTPAGYLPGMPGWVLEELQPSIIVLVEATSEEINRRRTGDESRSRDVDTSIAIAEHQALNRAAAMAYATQTGATVKMVANHDDAVEEAVEDLTRAVDSFGQEE